MVRVWSKLDRVMVRIRVLSVKVRLGLRLRLGKDLR